MTENSKPIVTDWDPEDDAPELTEEVATRAQISIGGKVIRKATGTLTRPGRPPIGAQAKQQVTLRLPREVIAHFKAAGPGWQTRISDALQRYAEDQARTSV